MVNDLATQGARASAAKILAQLPQKYSGFSIVVVNVNTKSDKLKSGQV